jgi:hypothetical protein
MCNPLLVCDELATEFDGEFNAAKSKYIYLPSNMAYDKKVLPNLHIGKNVFERVDTGAAVD